MMTRLLYNWIKLLGYSTYYDKTLNLGFLQSQHYFLLSILLLMQPEMRKKFTEIFANKTRDEWTEIFSSMS